MSKNIGKIFETNFIKSVPNFVLSYRLPDSPQSFKKNSNLRFSRKSPFDYLLWDSKSHTLLALELKTISTKSISFERKEDDDGTIHLHQIKGLREWSKYDGIICGFIIEFRQLEKTIFLNINDFDTLINKINKKSFNIDDLDKNGIKYIIINQAKKIKYYRYDVKDFLYTISNYIKSDGGLKVVKQTDKYK